MGSRAEIAEGVALLTAALSKDPSIYISCRLPSPQFTTKRRAPRTPTGRRFWRCTIC